MSNYIATIKVDAVIDALAAFIANFYNGAQIIRAQVNRVPMPSSKCVVLTELIQSSLIVPFEEPDGANDAIKINENKRIDVQVDFYGADAGDVCAVVMSAFRSNYGFNHFPSNIKPLYTTDGIQSPLITGEQQYESRWTLTVSIEYNPVVSVPQDFFNTADMSVVSPVDVIFPP